MKTYKIIRIFADPNKQEYTVRGLTNLTLAQAQAHCRNNDTSSSTCRTDTGLARFKKYGDWFDGYAENR